MSHPRSAAPVNDQINDEAARWFVEFSTGTHDARQTREFDTWLRKSPEHVRAYLEMFPVWEDAACEGTARGSSAEELIARASSEPANVVRFEKALPAVESSSRMAPRARRPSWLAAAAILLIAIASTLFWQHYRGDLYVTAIGEQRSIALPDGSTIELNARSTLRVRFTSVERRVELVSGQALFRVARDSRRPFVVQSDRARVRALGTRFDVNERRASTTVTVLEGTVGVASSADEIVLAAGERLSVTPDGVGPPTRAGLSAAIAWRQRRLDFSSTPLADVAEEFNRYNERQLEIRDPRLESLDVSGVFSASDLPSLVRFLRAQPGITVEERGRVIRVVGNSR